MLFETRHHRYQVQAEVPSRPAARTAPAPQPSPAQPAARQPAVPQPAALALPQEIAAPPPKRKGLPADRLRKAAKRMTRPAEPAAVSLDRLAEEILSKL